MLKQLFLLLYAPIVLTPFITHDPQHLLIVPQQKMEMMLDTLIGEVSYLNLCAMNVLLCSKAVERPFPFFEAAASKNERGLKEAHKANWSHVKIRNSIQMFRAFRHWNRLHKNNFNNRVKQIKTDERLYNTAITAKNGFEDKPGLFRFVEKVEQHMVDQFGAMFSTLDLEKISSTRKALEAYFKECDIPM